MKTFSKTFSNFFQIQTFFKTRKIILIFFLFTLCTLLEFLNIALILPVISLVLSDDINDRNSLILNYFGLDDFIVDNNLIYLMCLIILFIFLAKLIILLISGKLQANFFALMRYKISSYFFKLYISKPYIYFLNENESSKVIRNITMLSSSYSGFLERFLMLANDFFIFLGIVFVIIYYDPIIFLIISSIVLLISVIYISFTKNYFYNLGQSLLGLSSNLLKDIQEALNNITQIKLLKKENYFEDKFNFKAQKNSYQVGNLTFYQSIPKLIMEFISVVMIFSLIIFLVYDSRSKEDIISLLTLFSIVIIRIIPFSSKLISFLNSISSFAPSLNLLRQELNINKKEFDNIEYFENKFQIKKIDKINLENVSFTYPKSNENLFNNINLELKKNNLYGIFGPSGSGKTTLINLINGLIKPNKGLIKYNDVVVNNNEFANIAYVSQQSYFQHDSIKNNIAFGILNKEIDEDKIKISLKKVNLFDLVCKLDNGIETFVSELGSNFSGGQLQRLSIARAIYADTDVIILDEPTSSLDEVNRSKILDLIKNLKINKIVIMITHNEDDLSICQKIIRINQKNLNID